MSKKQEWTRTFAVVRGSGDFPVDMLRYDACFPATEHMSHVIQNRIDCRHVIVARYTGQPGNWTPLRWRSFTWTFLDTYDDEYAAQAYINAQEKAHAENKGK